MNRIAGIFNFDLTPIDPREINRMVKAMEFQDLDQQGTWIEAGVGLGCTRNGNGPGAHNSRLLSFSTNERSVITFDGRIDNHQELLKVLKPQLADRCSLVSAEEIVLAAYERWGLECPARLTGDFAFALWDGKKHRLVCARDHFGVKPFYYHLSKNTFVFASAPRALLASGKVPLLIHADRIADFLVNPLEGVDKTSSFYELEPYLPSEVIWKKDKESLMWEVNRLILKERAAYIYQITSDEQADLKPYIDVRKLLKFWHEYLTLGDEKHAESIWLGVALGMWLRQQKKMKVNLNLRV